MSPDATLLKRRLQYACLSVNFAKFLRTSTEHTRTFASNNKRLKIQIKTYAMGFPSAQK